MSEIQSIPQDLPDLFAYAQKQYELSFVARKFDNWLTGMAENETNKVLRFPDWLKQIKNLTKPNFTHIPEIRSILQLTDAFADELDKAYKNTLHPNTTLSYAAETMRAITQRGRILLRSKPNIFEGHHIPIQLIRIPIDMGGKPVGSYLSALIIEPNFNGATFSTYHQALSEIALWDVFYTSEQMPGSMINYRVNQPSLARVLGTNSYAYLPYPPLYNQRS